MGSPHQCDELTDVEQISNMGWKGDAYNDMCRFKAIDRFIMKQTDREVQRRAMYLLSLHGMGFDEPVSDNDLNTYLNEIAEMC